MKKTLSQEERQLINAHFSTGETGALLRACRTSFAHRAVMLEGVKVEPEDIFCEVIEVLDDLMQDASERTQSAVDDVFTQVMYRVREWQEATPNDRKLVADSVFRIVRKLLCHYWDTRYSHCLYDCFSDTLKRRGEADDSEDVTQFNSRLTACSTELNEWVNNHYDGYLGEEIQRALKDKRLFLAVVTKQQKAEAIIAYIHQLMEGKQKPKDVMMPIRAAIDAGVIRRPTEEEFCDEFGKDRVKAKSSINDYTNPLKIPYDGNDYETMKSEFQKLLGD